MDILKIDIIGNSIYCYDKNMEKKVHELNTEYSLETSFGSVSTFPYKEFVDRFSDRQDLLTVDISIPTKRLMKFYDIKDSIPGSFTEILYSNMNNADKLIVDNFINIIQSK
jgi:hypothetical protein